MVAARQVVWHLTRHGPGWAGWNQTEEVSRMRALVAYESMYGNTRQIAEAVADGLRTVCQVDLIPADRVSPEDVRRVDLLVLGGPTHGWRPSTSKSRDTALKDQTVQDTLAATSVESGARELIGKLPPGEGRRLAAVFDTRLDRPKIITGAASRGLGKMIRQAGYQLVAPPESFQVSGTHGPPVEGEVPHAYEWGVRLAQLSVPTG